VLVLGILTYISGLRLAGVPVMLPGWLRPASASQQAQSAPAPTKTIVKAQVPIVPTGPDATTAIDPITPVQPPTAIPGVDPITPTGANPAEQTVTEAPVPPPAPLVAELTLNAQNNGYYPQQLFASSGTPVKLNVVTDNTRSCAVAFVIPELNYETILPQTGTTTIDIPAQPAGKVMAFTCSMGMYTGEIVFQ
jgi:hypothetical protein